MGNNDVGVVLASALRGISKSKTGIFIIFLLISFTVYVLVGSPGAHHLQYNVYPCANQCHDPKCVSAAHKPPSTSFVLVLPKHVASVSIVLFPPDEKPLVVAELPSDAPFTILVMPSLAQALHNEKAGVCEPRNHIVEPNGMRKCMILHAELGSEHHTVIQGPSHLTASFPTSELLQAIPASIPIESCSFSKHWSNAGALMSAGHFIRRCISVIHAEFGSADEKWLNHKEVDPSRPLDAKTHLNRVVVTRFMEEHGFKRADSPKGSLHPVAYRAGDSVWEQEPQISWTPAIPAQARQAQRKIIKNLHAKFSFPPDVKRVVVDIGLANKILQPKDPDTWVIAVEASRKEMIKNDLFKLCAELENCILLHAAISNSVGFLQFFETTRVGGSSVDVPDPDVWPMELGSVLSPVIPLRIILDSIPDDVEVVFCKTDTNGNDHKVLRSAGSSIAKCRRHLRAEFINNGQAGKACQEESAIEFMEHNGFSILWKENTFGVQTKPWRDIMFSARAGAPHTGAQDMGLVDYKLFVKDSQGENTAEVGISN